MILTNKIHWHFVQLAPSFCLTRAILTFYSMQHCCPRLNNVFGNDGLCWMQFECVKNFYFCAILGPLANIEPAPPRFQFFNQPRYGGQSTIIKKMAAY